MINQWIFTFSKRREVVEVQITQQLNFTLSNYPSPIHWHSKKQTLIETSSIGSEFMAMKHVTEYIKGLSYKLQMIEISIVGCVFILGDNQSVLKNTTSPDYKLMN